MVQSPYNPQEVLGPLMRRFGRHLDADRDEGFRRMVGAVQEELRVDEEHARQLMQGLQASGLVAYERSAPISDTQAMVQGQTTPPPPAPGEPAPRDAGRGGSWRIGPIAY